MRHDKKNTAASTISFTLLRRPGAVAVSHSANPANITAAFEIYRDLLL